MRKIFISICALLLSVGIAQATLWDYYNEQGQELPSVADRVLLAQNCGISDYTGTLEQNIKLEECLRNEPVLGVTIPDISALFQTSLQGSIASDATTMTLVSATLANGNSLSGVYGFIIDEGSSNEEFVICTASGTSLSSCLRGIDPVDGQTEVTALQKSHRRGASVKITDFPLLGVMRKILTGEYTLPNSLQYASSTSIGNMGNNTVATKYYVDTVGAGGFTAVNASTTRGVEVYGTSPETIGVNASTTLGMQYNSDGSISPKLNAFSLYADSNGIGVNAGGDFTWTGNNTFSGTNTFTGTTTFTGNVSGIGAIYGDGSDGALNITSGTTDINGGSANVIVKNYSSINIDAGATLNLSTTATTTGSGAGTLLILKSRGDCTIAGNINLSGKGGAGGLAPTTAATIGDDGSGFNTSTTAYGGYNFDKAAHYGRAGLANQNGSGLKAGGEPGDIIDYRYYTTKTTSTITQLIINVVPGDGGGSGGTGYYISATASGKGGNGGGALILYCGGSLNFTGSIDVSGQDGTSAVAGQYGAAGGGGGAGGMVLILYESLTANTGTIDNSGGNGGNGAGGSTTSGQTGGSGGGGAGGSYIGGTGGTGANGGKPGGNGGNGTGSSGAGGGGGGAEVNQAGGTGGTGGTGDTAKYLITKNIWF